MDEQNQCDGCRRGLPVENGIHHGPTAWDIMRCTADRYRRAGMSNLPPLPEFSHFLENSTHEMQRDAIRAFARSFAEEAVRLEREQCAELCDHLWTRAGDADQCADAIRARSQEG